VRFPCSFHEDPRSLAFAQSEQSASNAYDKWITEWRPLRDADLFARRETEIQQAGTILMRAIQPFDAYSLVQSYASQRAGNRIHQLEMKTTIIFNFHNS
jgi:hypothetical protein